MSSDLIGVIARWLTGMIVDSAVDVSEEAGRSFGRRFPRALRLARLVGGAFLVLAGLYEAVLSIVVFVYVTITGDFDDRLVTPVLLLPFSMGVGLTIWGLRMVRRGWATRLDGRTRSSNPDPYVPKAAEERPQQLEHYRRF